MGEGRKPINDGKAKALWKHVVTQLKDVKIWISQWFGQNHWKWKKTVTKYFFSNSLLSIVYFHLSGTQQEKSQNKSFRLFRFLNFSAVCFQEFEWVADYVEVASNTERCQESYLSLLEIVYVNSKVQTSLKLLNRPSSSF